MSPISCQLDIYTPAYPRLCLLLSTLKPNTHMPVYPSVSPGIHQPSIPRLYACLPMGSAYFPRFSEARCSCARLSIAMCLPRSSQENTATNLTSPCKPIYSWLCLVLSVQKVDRTGIQPSDHTQTHLFAASLARTNSITNRFNTP